VFGFFEHLASAGWGQGGSIDLYAPSLAGSARARQEIARWERMAASPSALLRMLRLCRSIDVRDVLAAIRVPTLIIQRENDRVTPPCHGRYLADHIAGARYFEQPGDHLLWLGDTDAMFAEIERFLTAASRPVEADRVLATILRVAVADSYHDAISQHVRSHRGRLISSGDDGVLATFDGPGRAIRCAAAIREAAITDGIRIRAAVHTGEVEFLAGTVAGNSIHVTDCVAALAQPAEILVTRTVKDLVAGSGISFADRGSSEPTATADGWPLFAVVGV
jgi:class 3 adenylate cyclase